ncbi:MAG: DMT family transporter [Deltaproteobacteria bacterium]|nr:DMT family transporter [Deltaproteobacteria bacterium]
MIILFSLLAFVNGGFLMLSQLLNAGLGLRIGPFGGSLVNHVAGALFGGLLLVVGFGAGHFVFSGVPVLYFLGGCIGVFIVALFNYSVPLVGAAFMSVLWTSAQLFVSSLIDHFGWLGSEPIPISASRLVGVGLLALGAYLVFSARGGGNEA